VFNHMMFLNEQEPRFALYVFTNIFSCYLCILELDIEGGKLILHQLLEINSELTRFARFSPNFVFSIDRQALLSQRSSFHILRCYLGGFYNIYFKIEFSQDGKHLNYRIKTKI
jgi:hypothetical protein